MACRACHYAVLRTLRFLSVPVTSARVFRHVNWWTCRTIEEALKDLIRDGAVLRSERFGNAPVYYLCPQWQRIHHF
jgi:hypothetical protein